MTGKAEFVVVANRLPVDLEQRPTARSSWKRSPGGLVTALEPMLRSRDGAWVGWPGLPDADAEPFEDDGLQLHPVTPVRPRTSRTTTRASPTARSGRSTTTSSPRRRSTGTGGRPTCGSTSGSPRPPRRSPPRARRSGCRTTSCSCSRAMLRDLRPDLRIGFFLHIPFPPVELFMQLPVARADRARACSAPTSSASTRRAARATSAGWPRGWPGRRPAGQRRGRLPRAGPSSSAPSPSRSTSRRSTSCRARPR